MEENTFPKSTLPSPGQRLCGSFLAKNATSGSAAARELLLDSLCGGPLSSAEVHLVSVGSDGELNEGSDKDYNPAFSVSQDSASCPNMRCDPVYGLSSCGGKGLPCYHISFLQAKEPVDRFCQRPSASVPSCTCAPGK